MVLLHWLMNHKLFLIFGAGILFSAALFVNATENLFARQTGIAEIQLINTEPPQDKISFIVTKREFDHRYELERYWGYERMEYMNRVFLSHKIMAVFAEKYNKTASPLEIRERRFEEQRRAGLSDKKWRQLLEENDISEKEMESIMREKVLVEKFLDLIESVDISDEEIASFYRAYLKDIPGWGADAHPDDVARLALRYKKLLTVTSGNFVGTYQKIIFLIQSPYLCRRSS